MINKFYNAILLVFAIVFTQNIHAQTCFGNTIKKGSGYEMASFNAKGKLQSKNVFTFKDVRKEGEFTVIEIENETFSAKGKSEGISKYSAKCNGNKLLVDGQSMISAEQQKSMAEYKMTFTGSGLERPSKFEIGKTLPDSNLKGKGKASAMDVTMDLNIINRKVESKEKITTPYGTHEAFKINADLTMKMVTIIPISFEYQVVSYVLPNELWDLKTETYRKGKLMSYSELVRVF